MDDSSDHTSSPEVEISFEHLLEYLASSSIDASPPNVRKRFEKMAVDSIPSEVGNERIWARAVQLVALTKSCCSPHSRKRLVRLLLKALSVSTAPSNYDNKAITGHICSALCKILSRTTNPHLMQLCLNQIGGSDRFASQVILNALSPIWKEADESVLDWCGALSLSNHVLSQLDESHADQIHTEMLSQLLKLGMGTKRGYIQASQAVLLRPFLLSISQTQANSVLAPTIALKLRANPETVIDFVYVIFENLSPSMDITQTLLETSDVKLFSAILKQIRSTKDHVRRVAVDIFVRIAAFVGGDESVAYPSGNTVLTYFMDAMTPKPKDLPLALALNQPNFRNAAFEVIGRIGGHLSSSVEIISNLNMPWISTTDSVLHTLVSALLKEPVGDSFVAANQALMVWTWISKALCRLLDVSNQPSGYMAAIDFFTKPILNASLASNASSPGLDFRSLGSLVFLIEMQTCMGHLDLLDTLILDIMQRNEKKCLAGLQVIVETAIKKFTNYRLVPQVDGMIAIFIELVHLSSSSTEGVNISKLSSSTLKVLNAGGSLPFNSENVSFLYTKAMLDAASNDILVKSLLHMTIARFHSIIVSSRTSMSHSGERLMNVSKDSTPSAAAYAFASCISSFQPRKSLTFHGTVLSVSLCLKCLDKSIMAICSSPVNRGVLLSAIFSYADSIAYQNDMVSLALTRQEARALRETIDPVQESLADNGHPPIVTNSSQVRRIARMLLKSPVDIGDPVTLGKGLVLLHAGSTSKLLSRQRVFLSSVTVEILSQIDKSILLQHEVDMIDSRAPSMDKFLVDCASFDPVVGSDDSHSSRPIHTYSNFIYLSSLSLLSTFGILAGRYKAGLFEDNHSISSGYETAWFICVERIAPRLSARLLEVLHSVEGLNNEAIDLFKGVSIEKDKPSDVHSEVKTVSKNRRVTEDEKWDEAVRRELDEKKLDMAVDGKVGLPSDRHEDIGDQRTVISKLLFCDFSRSLQSLENLFQSDLELGNYLLQICSKSVLWTVLSPCYAFQSIPSIGRLPMRSLRTLAECVYEIDETHVDTLLRAIICSCTRLSSDQPEFVYRTLPLHCPPVAETFALIQDLSAGSFMFIFPIIRSALTGPRTCSGCEEALRILHRHTCLLDHRDHFMSLRKEMAETILGLLNHDRFQTFTDPSPVQALESVYLHENDALEISISTSDLSPLLGTMGALGMKNGRIAAMTVLTPIIYRFPALAYNNALLENRLWINCFADEDEIKLAARAAWRAGYGTPDDSDISPPSKIVTTSLLPLLYSSDLRIARAAAAAFANSLCFHQEIIEMSIYRVLNSYIDAFPTATDDSNLTKKQLDHGGTSSLRDLTKPQLAVSAAKKPVKKPTASTAVSAMSALTATKKKSTIVTGAASKSTLNNVLKPKETRVLDKELLEAQLKVSSPDNLMLPQKDSEGKILIRRGAIRMIASVAAPTCNINLSDSVLKLLVGFLLAFGLADRNDNVYGEARDSLRDIVASCGASEEALKWLFPVLENVLISGKADFELIPGLDTQKVPEDLNTVDRRKEGVVVALGSAAAHLQDDINADKISETIDMLIKTLSAPSESVQSSVALCISKLMKKGRTQDRVEAILSSLLKICFCGNSLAERRGAAYGIAAVIKGSGIAALKKFDVVKQLEDACTTGTSNTKEGALFAIELLSSHLGLLFEPYVIILLPALLQSFSDNSVHVRAAAQTTVATIMNKLSGHGVKLILPSVLAGLENDEWRAAVASISLLGSMSNLAPKQLATCLPQIVPKLTEAFAATHPKVKFSAENALDEIVKVVRNPEIKDISKILLNALKDPSACTSTALEALIETEFVHAIDAPSLSLIIPVLHRGLRDRAATTKRFGALIAGNICTMINDPKDFIPYVPLLLADLKATLVDPIPDCRTTAAKSLGSLTRILGEAAFPDLRPWLVAMLKNDVGSSVEKSGAAQGLSEVLCAGGATMVESVLREEILPLRSYPKASVREGVFWVLTFLPSSLGQAFAPLIDYTFPALIFGLSDESELVRDVSMRAGRIMIQSHGKAHVDKFLPSLEANLSDVDSRIRVSSLTLLGDLFCTIAGAKISKGESDTQDDLRQTERAQSQIALILGPAARKRILSSIYFRRSDSAAIVRQSAIQVWKSVVSVTPRTLREILETLVGQIAMALASGDPDRTSVGGRCLGDLTSKLGDTVLPEIIPILQKAQYSGEKHTRIGSCVGLTEVISCSTKEQLLKFLEILVKAVRDALCDEDEDVRKMAISAFQQLYGVVGSRVLDEIVPVLLVSMDMDDETRKRAVYGLTGILTVRSKELLPFLVPRLLRKPITDSQAKALASVCAATSGTIHLFFPVIIPALLTEISSLNNSENEADKERQDSLRTCVQLICRSIDQVGVNPLISEITSKCASDKDVIRKESCWFFSCLIDERKKEGDFYDFIPLIMRELLYRLNDDKMNVVKSAHDALFTLSNNVTAEVLVDHVEFLRNVIASLVSDARRRKGGVGDGEFFLPGFNIPKGLEPLLPIYQRGILYGDSSVRETAAHGLGDLIKLTSTEFLGPLAVKITGPLLRIVGDRNPSSVKVAIIETLGLILLKGGPLLKAFAPQFQTTFVKALSDPSRLVRLEAIKALGLLMPLSMRVDPLIKELVSIATGESSVSSSIESAGIIAVQIASLEALVRVIQCGGTKVKTSDIVASVLGVGEQMARHDDEDMREAAMKLTQVALDLQKSL